MVSNSPFALLIETLLKFVQFYSYLLIGRVLLTWFPQIEWSSQPFAALSQITDPYLNLFRNIIPPLGGIDLSPILAFLALNVVSGLLAGVASSLLASAY